MSDDRATTLGTAIIFSTAMPALAAFYADALDLGVPETAAVHDPEGNILGLSQRQGVP